MAKNDPQSAKKKTFAFFGQPEDRAIASAEYKRGMGINPKAKRISNAEASRSARAMDNPTSRPQKLNAEQRVSMDDMAKKKKAAPKESKQDRLRVIGGTGFAALPSKAEKRVQAAGAQLPGKLKRGGFPSKADELYYYGSNADAPKKKKGMTADQFRKGKQGQAGVNVVSGAKAGVSTANSNASQGKKPNKPTKYPGFKGNWKGAAPMSAQEPKTAAQAARRADGGAEFARKKMKKKLRSIF